MLHNFIRLLLLAAMLGNCGAAAGPGGQDSEYTITRGTLDLRSFEATTLQALPLRGEWAFFWQNLRPGAGDQPLAYGPVNISWIAAFAKDYPQVNATGYATYRLRILLPPAASRYPWGIRSRAQTGAITLRLNGQDLLSDGVPGETMETTELSSGKGQALFRLPDSVTPEVTVEITVANPDHPRGGAGGDLYFGPAEAIEKQNRQAQGMDLFVATGLFLFGIYHLGMFAIRREEKAALYFSFFLLVIAMRTLVTGEFLARELWPSLPFQLEVRNGYFSYFFASGVALLYFHSVFPLKILTKFIYATVGIASVFSILSFLPFVSRGDLAEIVRYYHVVTMVILILGLILCVNALRNRESGSLIFLLGFTILVAAAIYDILSNLNVVQQSTALFPLGLMAFSISQSFLIYTRFSQTFREVALLSSRLHSTNRDLEEMARVKDAFMAHLSHELRTPLTLIQGSAEMMEMSDSSTELWKNSLKRIQGGSATLSSYVDDLMLVTDVESTPDLDRSVVDLSLCCQEALSTLETLIREQRISVQCTEENLPLEGDQRLLQRMILSVIKNAVLYNSEGGQLRITGEEGSESVKLFIEDDGPGIPPSERAAIFEKFHRVRTDKPGVGLGLFLARRIANLHGGEISLQASNKGTTFCIALPARQLSR